MSRWLASTVLAARHSGIPPVVESISLIHRSGLLYSAGMSRLCCSDPGLFARYSRGQLVTDLSLKSSLGTARHSISSVLLQTYSVQLADFATIALTSSSKELVLEDASPRALELFVHGIYGISIDKTLSDSTDCLTESNIDICDIKEIWAFGHRYNIGQIEIAVCDLITSHLPELGLSKANDVINFYNSVPTESDDLQDAIFQILLGFQEEQNFLIMDPKEHIFIKIAPRHVNEIFSVKWDNAAFLLSTLQLCVKHQVTWLMICVFCSDHDLD